MERLYRALENYSKSDYYPFHMPGHKRNKASVNGNFPIETDITEIEGFDNLHHPEGILKKAQETVAKIYGTKESFYSVNGSTAALLSAVSAAAEQHGAVPAAMPSEAYRRLYPGDTVHWFSLRAAIRADGGVVSGAVPIRIQIRGRGRSGLRYREKAGQSAAVLFAGHLGGAAALPVLQLCLRRPGTAAAGLCLRRQHHRGLLAGVRYRV